jgi:hypothetical protein
LHKIINPRRVTAFSLTLLICGIAHLAQAQQKSVATTETPYEAYVPDTISPESQQVLRMMTGPQDKAGEVLDSIFKPNTPQRMTVVEHQGKQVRIPD